VIIRHMQGTFGTLDGEQLRLDTGLNIIYAPNESGKSTWCAFLRAMLYGIDTSQRARAGFVPDKQKYAPWSGKPMAGELELEQDGKRITIRRWTEAKSAPMRAFSAVYTGTDIPVPGLTATDAGEQLTGVSAEVFQRSAFIGQGGLVVTGTPVRLGFMRSDKSAARRALGIAEDEPLVVSVWGSLGATEMNKTVARMIALAMDGAERPFRLVHSAGKRGINSMTEYMSEELGLSDWKEAGFDVVDYIYDMPLLMAAADIVLCRSGASTLAELTAIGKPAILVPSPNVVNNHQEKNARVLERGGGAVVLLESDAGADVMLSTINGLLSDKEKLAEMEEHMRDLAVENATDEITSIVLSLASGE